MSGVPDEGYRTDRLWQCPTCGMQFVPSYIPDRRHHAKFHRSMIRPLNPKPQRPLARLHANHGDVVPVTFRSPEWLIKRVYEMARAFKREIGYDMIPWPDTSEGLNFQGKLQEGALFIDVDGRALGAASFVWEEYKNAAARWVMIWVWIAPPYRRQGVLRRAWPLFVERYGNFLPKWPYSDEIKRFLVGAGRAHFEPIARDLGIPLDAWAGGDLSR